MQVRASRSLPLRLMAAEYEHILKRRLKRVGGSPDDPALTQLLEHFKCALCGAEGFCLHGAALHSRLVDADLLYSLRF